MRPIPALLAAAAATAVLAGTVPAATAAPALPRVYTTDGYHSPVLKPKTIYLDDGTNQDRRLRWHSWTSTRAVTSYAIFRSCAASCVYDKARVTLYAPAGRTGHRYFTKMYVHLLTGGQTFNFIWKKADRAAKVKVWMDNLCLDRGTC